MLIKRFIQFDNDDLWLWQWWGGWAAQKGVASCNGQSQGTTHSHTWCWPSDSLKFKYNNDDNDQSKKVWPVQKTEGPCSSPSLVIGTPVNFKFVFVCLFFKHTLKLVRVLHWKRCGRWGVWGDRKSQGSMLSLSPLVKWKVIPIPQWFGKNKTFGGMKLRCVIHMFQIKSINALCLLAIRSY